MDGGFYISWVVEMNFFFKKGRDALLSLDWFFVFGSVGFFVGN